MKRLLGLTIWALAAMLSSAGIARAQNGPIQGVTTSSTGQPRGGVNVAVCSTLTTTAASVTNNVATYTFGSNPQTAGFATSATFVASGFTGGDTFFNTSAPILSTSSTTISIALVHANASAGTNGTVYQTGSSTQACAPLASLSTDNTGNFSTVNPFTSDGLGNYLTWAAPNYYRVQLYGPGVTTFVYATAVACVPQNSANCGALLGTVNAWTAPQTFASINGALYMGAAGGQYATLQAAHDALPSTGGTIVMTPGYLDTETVTVNITKPRVSVLCLNQMHFLDSASDSTIAFNHTSVGINVTGIDFGIEGCHLKIATTSSRVGVPMIDSNTTEGGRLSNLLVTGQGGSPNNGIFFRSTDASVRQGIWQLDNIWQRDGNTWTSIISVAITSNSLTGAYYKFRDIINSDSEKYTDSAIVLDGTIDTVTMDNIGVGNALVAGGKTIWARNTVSSSGSGYPRWVHCSNCYLEAGGPAVTGGTGLQVDSGRDIDYWGYNASAGTGVAVTGSLMGVNIHDTVFTNMISTGIAVTGGLGVVAHHNSFAGTQQTAISYAGGGGLTADANVFYDSGCQTTNTYDTISVAAGTANGTFTNNSWLNQCANKPRYGINFLGGETDMVVSGNNYGSVTFGTGFLNPPSSGSRFQIMGQESTVVDKLTSTLSSIGYYSNLGTACTNGELGLSAGWQSTGAATVTAVAGIGQTCNWTITTGTTTAANPTVTDTLVNALPAATIVCEMSIHGGTHTPAAGEGFTHTGLSATAPVFTFIGTPTAGGTTYFVTRRCGP